MCRNPKVEVKNEKYIKHCLNNFPICLQDPPSNTHTLHRYNPISAFCHSSTTSSRLLRQWYSGILMRWYWNLQEILPLMHIHIAAKGWGLVSRDWALYLFCLLRREEKIVRREEKRKENKENSVYLSVSVSLFLLNFILSQT